VAVERFKQKGFKVMKTDDLAIYMSGKIMLQDVELYLILTPKSKQFCRLTVYLEKQETWDMLNEKYEEMVETLTKKYGQPDYISEKFTAPYELNDGYEMVAVQSENCQYSTTWLYKDNTNVQVEISKYKQVKITYENEILMQKRSVEMDQVKSNIY
jgi:hypothetical protein